MLLIDEVSELVPGDHIVATFWVDPQREIFKGHFPGNPICPGVIQIETMAQVAGAGLVACGFLGDNASFLFAKVEEAKLKKPIRPGDKITVITKTVKLKKIIGVFEAKGYVNGELAVEGTLTCMLGGAK